MRSGGRGVRYWALLLGIGIPLTFGCVYLLASCAQGPQPLG
ncbi:MAG: hypothetical protein U0556_19165 [Dehalococcoidia bacterium]